MGRPGTVDLDEFDARAKAVVELGNENRRLTAALNEARVERDTAMAKHRHMLGNAAFVEVGKHREELADREAKLVEARIERDRATDSLRLAHEVIAAIDEVLGNGADEYLWPPGMTRAESIRLMKQRGAADRQMAERASREAQRLTGELTRLTGRLDLLEPLVGAAEAFRKAADDYDLRWTQPELRLMLHMVREDTKTELARLGRFVATRLQVEGTTRCPSASPPAEPRPPDAPEPPAPRSP